jgi:hypothetical protein
MKMAWACYRRNILVSAEGKQMFGISNLYEEGTPPTDEIMLRKTGFAVVKTIRFGPGNVMDPFPFLGCIQQQHTLANKFRYSNSYKHFPK